jgi:hypothetical protein
MKIWRLNFLTRDFRTLQRLCDGGSPLVKRNKNFQPALYAKC